MNAVDPYASYTKLRIERPAPKVLRVIMDNGTSIQIADIARQEGYNNLRTSALEKVAQGLTSLAEANRIT